MEPVRNRLTVDEVGYVIFFGVGLISLPAVVGICAHILGWW